MRAKEGIKIKLQDIFQRFDLVKYFFIGAKKLDSLSQEKISRKKPSIGLFPKNRMILAVARRMNRYKLESL